MELLNKHQQLQKEKYDKISESKVEYEKKNKIIQDTMKSIHSNIEKYTILLTNK